MITTSKREQRRGVLPVALMLSLLFNLVAGSVFTYLYGFDRIARILHLKAEMPDKEVAVSQSITITHRNVPIPTPATKALAPRAPAARPKAAAPVPQAVAAAPAVPVARPVATPHPVVHHHAELAKVRPHSVAMAQHSDSATTTTTSSEEPPSPSKALTVPKQTATNGTTGAPSEHGPRLSHTQIAQLEGEFSKTIAQAQADENPIRAAKLTPQATMKHFGMQFSGIHAGLSPGEGYIEPVSEQRIGRTMWYYTHYEYMYADGSVEEDNIPWPFHYPINNDPFARGDHMISLEEPPPDYAPNRPLKLQLQQFFPKLYPDASAELARKRDSG